MFFFIYGTFFFRMTKNQLKKLIDVLTIWSQDKQAINTKLLLILKLIANC